MASDYYRVSDRMTQLRSVTHSAGLAVMAILLSVVTVSVVAIPIVLAGISIQPMAALPPLPYAVLSASQFVGFFLTGLLYLWWRGWPDLFDVGLPSWRDLAWILGGFVALYGLSVGLTVVFQWLGIETATNQVVADGRQDPVRFLYMIPVTFLFVAPAEELLYRGVIQGLFRRAYGVVPGVLLASAMFGVGHWLALIGSGGGKVTYVASAAMLGLVLGTLYEFSENLTVPIGVHALYNALLFVGQYAAATGAAAG